MYICVNIIRHKCFLCGTTHLFTYAVIRKFKSKTLKVKIVVKLIDP